MKTGRINISAGRPINFLEGTEESVQELTEEQRWIIQRIGSSVKAYINAAQDLLEGKYAHLKDLTPVHLTDPGNTLVLSCSDGVVIRFDRRTDERRVISGWVDQSIIQVAPGLSENLIHCYNTEDEVPKLPPDGPSFTLSTMDSPSGSQREVVKLNVGFNAVIRKPLELPRPPRKPFCLLSVRNSFEIGLVGIMADSSDENFNQGREFLARTTVRFPAEWECIEIYPFVDAKDWDPEYAPIWAENDLLASAVSRQLRESHFQQLDPKAAARREFTSLLQSYKELLGSNPDEEDLQRFLTKHPNLLCPAHIQVWPKLKLGKNVTDFVFREATRDYLLVELERPSHKLFTRQGDLTSKVTHAHSQIIDWKRYIEDNLGTVRRELGLNAISSAPKCLIVIGRSKDVTEANRRKLQSFVDGTPKLKVLTYDDVYVDTKAVIENLLGPLADPGGNTQFYYPPPGKLGLPQTVPEGSDRSG